MPSPQLYRILLVAMPDSIHVARWLSANSNNNFQVMLFASSPMRRTHPEIKKMLDVSSGVSNPYNLILVRNRISFLLAIPLWFLDRRLLFGGRFRGLLIRAAIRNFQPQLVHTMESQNGGYSTFHALKKIAPVIRPKSLLTLFGSDIYWFSRFKYHQKRLRQLLGVTDAVQAECARDLSLAARLGFEGIFLPLLPVGAGIAGKEILSTTSFDEINSRSVIAVKGYGGKWGQALAAIDALKLSSQSLAGYTVEFYSCDKRVAKYARKRLKEAHINTVIHPKFSLSHGEMLALFRRSKLAIGLSKSDGLPASMLEAMSQGAFPVQTGSACVAGWIADGQTGAVISDLTPESIARTISHFVKEEATLHQAAIANIATIRAKYSDGSIREFASKIYKQVLDNRN